MLLQGKHAVVHVRKVVDTVHDLPNVLWGSRASPSGGGSVDDRVDPDPTVSRRGTDSLDGERTGLR
jgi:hypothetical protein